MAWDRGYVADIPYTSGYYRDMAPGHLALVALVSGVTPPDPSGPFRYLELGCGTGRSLATMAAANPQAEFVGVDFMPSHIAAARRLVKAAGLRNIRFIEASFEELLSGDEDLGIFDFTALHGVYTWVSRSVQQDIVRLLERTVAPGGLFYMGYNNMAGFQGMLSTQKLLFEHARRRSGDSASRVRAGLEHLLRLRAVGATGLDDHKLPDELRGPDANPDKLGLPMHVYLAHEYLAEHWRPLFITDVASDLAGAKLEFVGRSLLFEALPPLVLTDAQRDELSDPSDPILTELETDLISPMAFRRDVFVRGAMRLSPQRQNERLSKVELVMLVPSEAVPMKLSVLGGELKLDQDVYAPVLARLAKGPAVVGDLVAMAAEAGRSVTALELIAVIEGCGAAAAVTRTGGDIEAIRRFNVAVIESYRDQAAIQFSMASGLNGAGIDASLPECLAYLVGAGCEDSLAGMDVEPLRELASAKRDFWQGLQAF